MLEPISNGESALAILDEISPDLVLMDIQLEGEKDGIEVANEIRKRVEIPIIYLTAHSDEATLRRANVTEPYGYILKPFEGRELSIAIEMALYRHSAEQKLRRMENWLTSTIKSMGDAVLTTDREGRVTFMNQIAESLTGWKRADALGKRFDNILKLVDEKDNVKPIADLVERVVQEEMIIEIGMNTLLVCRAGNKVYVDDSAAPIRDNQGNIIGVVIVFRDMAVRRQIEEQLRYSANHDHLTGLSNRAFLTERLTQLIEHNQRYPGHKFALLLLDLDRFKNINDSLGHMAGDQVLITIAQRLEKVIRLPDTVARLGGDEFVILLEEVTQVRDAILVAERIQNDLTKPISLGTHEVLPGVSIGIVLDKGNHQEPEDVLRDADSALYQAKIAGKGCNVIFDTLLHQSAMASQGLEKDLRLAAGRKEFLFQYQPIVSPANGTIYGFEALLRWQHPERGLLMPNTFLDLAEETGFLSEIEEWLTLEACELIHAWQKLPSLAHPLMLSVNISRQQFQQTSLSDQVEFILSETGIEPLSLCLEIPENLFSNQDGTATILSRLHKLGVQLHVDNFGAGNSSLSVLHQSPANALKIDWSLVGQSNEGTQEENVLLRAIMMLAHELGMGVIAKGIETVRQATYLENLNCYLGQGYFWAKPLYAEDVIALLSQSGNVI